MPISDTSRFTQTSYWTSLADNRLAPGPLPTLRNTAHFAPCNSSSTRGYGSRLGGVWEEFSPALGYGAGPSEGWLRPPEAQPPDPVLLG